MRGTRLRRLRFSLLRALPVCGPRSMTRYSMTAERITCMRSGSMRFDRRNFLAGALSTGGLGVTAVPAAAQKTASSWSSLPAGDWLIDSSSYVAQVIHDPEQLEVTLSNGM